MRAGGQGFGEGGGPTAAQRVICGYAGRTDYVDSQGQSWRPATEVVTMEEKIASVNSYLLSDVKSLETTETVPTVSALAMTIKIK
jgi:hypothetical protein